MEAFGIGVLEELLHLGGHGGQGAALDGLHDDDGLVVLAGHLVALAGLDGVALPVGVVDLELDELHLRVVLQDVLQGLGGVVEGEADVLGLALGLHLLHKVPGPQLIGLPGPLGAHGVEQVEVVVFQAGPLQGGVQNLLELLVGLLVPQGQFRSALEAVPGVAVHHGLFQGHLAFAADVHIGGIEVGEALAHKGIHHLFGLVHVDLVAVHGQAHEAEAQLFDALAQVGICHTTFSSRKITGLFLNYTS